MYSSDKRICCITIGDRTFLIAGRGRVSMFTIIPPDFLESRSIKANVFFSAGINVEDYYRSAMVPLKSLCIGEEELLMLGEPWILNPRIHEMYK